jgi:hypothetical protein
VEDGGEYDCLKGGVVMSPDPALKRLEGLLQAPADVPYQARSSLARLVALTAS